MIHFEPTEDCSPKRLSTGVWVAVVAAAVVLMVAPAIPAEEEVPEDYGMTQVGMGLFRSYCKSCHGATAEGDGALASLLRVAPANLTRIQHDNDGTFPFADVVKRIDGREAVRGHGSSDMPIWGDAFMKAAGEGSEDGVRLKVEALAHYIRSLQARG